MALWLMQCCFAECRIKTQHAALVLTDQWALEGLDERKSALSLFSTPLDQVFTEWVPHSWRARLISFRWIQGILLMEASPMWLVTPNSEAWSLQELELFAFLMWNNQILLEGNSPRVKKHWFHFHLYWNLIGWHYHVFTYTLRVSFIYTPGRMMTLHNILI